MKSTVSILLFFSIILVTACGSTSTNDGGNSPTSSDTELEKVKLLLAAKGNPMFYAYIAKEKGFFQEEGLDVELVPEKGGANVVQQIGSGTADFGVVAVASLIPAWDQGMDIKVVYQINSTNLFDLIVPKYSDIKNINQLKGQAIGVTELSGAEVPMVQSLLAREGLHANEDVTLLPIGNDATTILVAFEKEKIAAYCGGAHDLVSLYTKGFQSKSLTPRAFKSLPSTAIIANGKIINERPDLVEKISRGIARGIDFSIKNRNLAFEIMKIAVPEEFADERVGQLGLNTFIDLSTPIETEKGYGHIYPDSWKKLIELFSEGEQPLLTKEIDVTKYLNTSFLEKANAFEK
ncbi:ABC transporter substrate-binding protein [Schinkia azotoformans]|uniref:Thiamine pyrimidine synthase n=1 Tax=Schinkia azotoformans LMG 9581 TaxID=1131731 RepID=K6D6W2_SCHAZ|nr:ABC transporter substrate-binding protein [Schinkia azotoformans]EKN68262.1 ABC transporter substrate-binding protein [Schinkia azotoformans LMG 9581]MEC1638624.1 ABC transporter substrate-binding protein [Schinkia azotoformans]MEC1945941.1 ABC transporter substrate-binding protein [Schinkia azotoformans]